eukprot:3247303-Amphidinium_carterae.1
MLWVAKVNRPSEEFLRFGRRQAILIVSQRLLASKRFGISDGQLMQFCTMLLLSCVHAQVFACPTPLKPQRIELNHVSGTKSFRV